MPSPSRKPAARPTRRAPLRLGFDSAGHGEDNRRHWANADGLSADSAANPGTRRILRNRCRYEVANNSYARGMILTLAHDVIGTGPRLQMLTDDAEYNKRMELEFGAWSSMVNLAGKLRTLRMARAQDGEAFAYLFRNPALDHRVILDVLPVEADRVSSPDFGLGVDGENNADGILFDEFDNPVAYTVLKHHPGDGDSAKTFENTAVRVEARDMIHFFRPERPSQHRGVPEIVPALPLFAQLRRFTLAVLSAAESAAAFAAILYTDCPPDGEAEDVKPMGKVNLERNMMTTMPAGWKLGQLDPKQPASTYAEFKKEILNEIARCLNMPFNVAAGNSSGYNYASGRLDHQSYYKAIKVDQHFTGSMVLDPILRAWLDLYHGKGAEHEVFEENGEPEEGAVKGFNPSKNATGCRLPPHQWFWDGMEHVDPAKEANALALRLSCGATSYAAEFGRQGKDFSIEMANQAKALGVTLPEYQALLRKKLFGAALPAPDEMSDETDQGTMGEDYE